MVFDDRTVITEGCGLNSPEIEGAKTPLAFQFTGASRADSLVLGSDTALRPWMVLERTP